MYTPSKIKISMLCALALCGQVRRDDLAIFARTADAGVRTIRELEDKGLIEDKTVEVKKPPADAPCLRPHKCRAFVSAYAWRITFSVAGKRAERNRWAGQFERRQLHAANSVGQAAGSKWSQLLFYRSRLRDPPSCIR